MPDAEPDPPPPVLRTPGWVPDAMLRAMERAAHRAFAWGRSAEGAADAAREVALAHMPAAPMPMIAEAVTAVVPDPEGWNGRRAPAAGTPVASEAEVIESLSYALRFGEDGKRNSGGNDFIAPMAAERLARHLRLSGFVVTRPPRAPVGPSSFGASNPGRPDVSP